MAKMTTAQIKEVAKENVLANLKELYENMGAEMVGKIAYVPQTVDGIEVWVEIKLTTKQWTNTKVSNAFDPFIAREEFETEQKMKEEEKAIKEKEKQAKIERSNARRAKAKKENEDK